MHKISFIIFVVAGCYGLLSCNSSDPGKTSGMKAENTALDKTWAQSFVDSVNKTFSAQIASGDSVALASHYWPDAELLLDNSDVVKGKDIINSWGAFIRMGVKEVTFSTTDITGKSPFIIETGNYEIKDGSKSLLDRGKYVVIWENRNGEWKLYRDIGSTSMPATK
jgi:ketosteroid isomerase-like protein